MMPPERVLERDGREERIEGVWGEIGEELVVGLDTRVTGTTEDMSPPFSPPNKPILNCTLHLSPPSTVDGCTFSRCTPPAAHLLSPFALSSNLFPGRETKKIRREGFSPVCRRKMPRNEEDCWYVNL
jgi:hypothetical protein